MNNISPVIMQHIGSERGKKNLHFSVSDVEDGRGGGLLIIFNLEAIM